LIQIEKGIVDSTRSSLRCGGLVYKALFPLPNLDGKTRNHDYGELGGR